MNHSGLRRFIRKILSEGACDTHRCLDGTVVDILSYECYNDICFRIEDAKQTRDMCPMRSDSRDHYNGILKVLRRKLNKAKKHVRVK